MRKIYAFSDSFRCVFSWVSKSEYERRSSRVAAPCDTTRARLAVFDFDGTCINGQSGSLFAIYLLRGGYLDIAASLRLSWWGLRYLTHVPHRQEEAREIILRSLSSLTADQVDQMMANFHDEILLPRYRSEAVEEVKRRRKEGCVVLLVSATFHPIAKKAADHLSMDGVIATEMARDGTGHYSGEIIGPVVEGRNKLSAVKEWADRHFGIGNWVLAYAYGDHYTDKELLSKAEQPFAVTPGKALRRQARRFDWTTLSWK
ncbi:MAG: haloacid dehalogenase-like hydrolase [Atopobium sp.]|jgi:HAD superfamily hydrolase (TIGR01490 family)|nr:haloacid dehalogenase-like hydrolase [Atopobium sp.]